MILLHQLKKKRKQKNNFFLIYNIKSLFSKSLKIGIFLWLKNHGQLNAFSVFIYLNYFYLHVLV